jgi:hypothetical protein
MYKTSELDQNGTELTSADHLKQSAENIKGSESMCSISTEEFLVFLDDGETFSSAGGDTAVIRGDWGECPCCDGLVWSDDDDDDQDHVAFRGGIKEVLMLTPENLLKIRKKLPELWRVWE